MFNYLIIDALIILFPLLLSFTWKFKYYRYFKSLAASILIVGTVYIFWDVLVTARGDWWFNEAFLSGVTIINLPIEEIMFFITVPFACLFIYENLVYFLPEKTVAFNKWTYYVIAGILIVGGLVFYHQDYTILALCSAAAFFIIAASWYPQVLQSRNFWLYIAISFIPFIIFNYLLTSLVVVHYNPDAIWGGDGLWNGRFLTIPFEDFFYNFSMLSFYGMVYIYFKERWMGNKRKTNEGGKTRREKKS